MSAHKHPAFSELSHNEAIALIKRNHVGRLAFSFQDRVDIEPISYVYENEWLYARTSEGSKLSTVHHNPWVAFEVDEVVSRFDWRSAVVRGAIYFPDRDRGGREREDYAAAVAVLRTVDSDAFTDADATPHRQSVFRIHADEITGRRASPG